MEREVTKEMLEKAKGAKSPQELLELAKAEGIELTKEAAAAIFVKLHPISRELSDEELENVAGGYYVVNLESGYSNFSTTKVRISSDGRQVNITNPIC